MAFGLFEPAGNRGLVAGLCAGLDQAIAVLGGTGLHHGDVDLSVIVLLTGDDEVEDGVFELLEGREGHPDPVDEPEAHRADRPFEGKRAQRQRPGGAVEGGHVVWVLLVGGNDRANDVGVVHVAVCKVWSQRTVDEPASQDRLLCGASFPAEERAGNAPDGVVTLLDVNREREEIGASARPFRAGCGDEDFGVSDAYQYGTVG